MRISDWSSDVCSSDLSRTASGDSRGHRGKPDWTDILFFLALAAGAAYVLVHYAQSMDYYEKLILCGAVAGLSWMAWLWRPLRTLMIVSGASARSEEHTSELQSLMRISYAVFCLKQKSTSTEQAKQTDK